MEGVDDGRPDVGGAREPLTSSASGEGGEAPPPDDLIVPSAEVTASVRHAPPPVAPPFDLVPYVVPVHAGDELDDWYLTEDTLAFAEPGIPTAFAEWRAEWERTWVLDPISSLERLCAAIAELFAPTRVGSLLCDLIRSGDLADGPAWIPEEMQQPVAATVERARDALLERGRDGYGFVDATPGRSIVGLARAWSGQTGREVLCADAALEVAMDPATGLSVAVRRSGAVLTVTGVEEVELREELVRVHGPGRTLELDLREARALGWLMPGSTRWRVRRVPEVVVWARTLHGLVECCRYASALHLPVKLTTSRPFSNDPA
jgi:hypothetical protein